VKVLSVAKSPSEKPIAIAEYPSIQSDYPLAEPLVLYLHPTRPKAARQFCEYAIGPDGSAIAATFGLVTPYVQRQAETEARLAELKSGRGVRLSSIGIGGGSKAVPDLAVEYVKAKAVVQMGYAATDSDVAAVGAFVRAGAEATSMPAEAGGLGAVAAAPPKPAPGTPATAGLPGPSAAAPSSAPAVRQGSPQATMPATAPAPVPPMTPFVAAGGKELLFLADKPSARAVELHGQKWNALGRDSAGKPNGAGPAEYLLAGRAVAVIVNPANKIDALTLAQLQAIFGGEVEDWGTLGNSGSQITGSQIKGSQIKAYGLRSDDLATGIFEKECLERAKWKRVGIKKDSAEVLAAVSMAPQAIAFVDLAAIPATGQNVRVLGIRLPGRGPAAPPPPAEAGTSPVGGGGVAERTGAAPPPAFAEATAGRPAPGATSLVRGGGVYYPTPENIKSAMYPLSQRLWLYVHPQASDTARDFVKFIATCGGSTSLTAGASEASPYADTVKSVMDTYRKHGLVPLADAALLRMVKDAMAEAAAKAKAGREKKK